MDPTIPERVRQLRERILFGPASLDERIRRGAAGQGEIPSSLGSYVDKVRRHAYRVTDEDAETLRNAGYTEDEILEATICAALGAAQERLSAALAALREDGSDATSER